MKENCPYPVVGGIEFIIATTSSIITISEQEEKLGRTQNIF